MLKQLNQFYLVNKNALSTCSIPGFVLGAEQTDMEKMIPALKIPSPSSTTMNQVNRSTLR